MALAITRTICTYVLSEQYGRRETDLRIGAESSKRIPWNERLLYAAATKIMNDITIVDKRGN